jgi:GTP-binding protein Era
LVINKVDLIPKERLLPQIDKLRAQHDFAAIIPASAKKAPAEASAIIMRELGRLLPEGPALYPPDIATDSSERELVAERIREKALLLLGEEVPHGVEVSIEQFLEAGADGIARIRATMVCEKDSHKKIIIGKGGASLKRIGTAARADIERMLGVKAYLELWVKVRKDWRDDAAALRQLGHAERP